MEGRKGFGYKRLTIDQSVVTTKNQVIGGLQVDSDLEP